MPISIGFSKEKGITFDGVRAVLAIVGLGVLCYLSARGNELATGALIPTLKELLDIYAKGHVNGVNGNGKTPP